MKLSLRPSKEETWVSEKVMNQENINMLYYYSSFKLNLLYQHVTSFDFIPYIGRIW